MISSFSKFHSCNPLQPGFSKPLLKIICLTLSGNKSPIFYWNREWRVAQPWRWLSIWDTLNSFLPIFLMLATIPLPAPEVPGAPRDGNFWAFCWVERADSWLSCCQIRTWLSLGLKSQWLLLHQAPQLPTLSHSLSLLFPYPYGFTS